MGAGGAGAQVGLAGLNLWEAKNQADAMKRQANFEAGQMEFNSKLVDMQAKEVGERAEKDVVQRESEIRQMTGTQKVSFAAQGIDLDSEVAQQVKEESLRVGREDVQAIKNNAWKEAWGMKMEAADMRNQAGFTRLGGGEKARQTMVTGGMKAVGNLTSAYSLYKGG